MSEYVYLRFSCITINHTRLRHCNYLNAMTLAFLLILPAILISFITGQRQSVYNFGHNYYRVYSNKQSSAPFA